MLSTLTTLVGAIAGLAWLSAVVHALLLLPHRQDGVSLPSLLVRGHLFYRAETWKDSGRAIHRRFLGSVLGFFGCVLLLFVLGLVLAR
ncbi:MAG: hypothetical protein U0234_19555 [Sandaracinus sp.]